MPQQVEDLRERHTPLDQTRRVLVAQVVPVQVDGAELLQATSAGCGGTLFAAFNRNSDLKDRWRDLVLADYPDGSEVAVAGTLFEKANYFINNVNDVESNQVQYECLPNPANDNPDCPDGRDGYNSNSFV